MDPKTEAQDFLTSRRARISPEDVGLTSFGSRQVAGLRREEVATLAGVSVDYYNRMERGNLAGVSEGVLDAVSRALRLDDAERAHLSDLARACNQRAGGKRRGPAKRSVRPSVEWMIDAMTGVAALVVNSRQDILAANHLGRALFAPLFEAPDPNMARFTYLDARAGDFFTDWNRMAKDCVAALRSQVGRDPFNRELAELVGELSTRSHDFAALWATHNVRLHHNVEKALHHPIAGDITLRYEQLSVAGDPGLEMFVYTAEPGSASAEVLRVLASWSAPDVGARPSLSGLGSSDVRAHD